MVVIVMMMRRMIVIVAVIVRVHIRRSRGPDSAGSDSLQEVAPIDRTLLGIGQAPSSPEVYRRLRHSTTTEQSSAPWVLNLTSCGLCTSAAKPRTISPDAVLERDRDGGS